MYEKIQIKTTQNRLLKDQVELFSGYLDSDFKDWNVTEKITPRKELNVKMETPTKDFKLADIFTDPEKMYMSQEEVISFVENNKDQFDSSKPYQYTFFLLKSSSEFFVARVLFGGRGRLGLDVRRLSDDFVWYAGLQLRFVVPATDSETLETSDTQALKTLDTYTEMAEFLATTEFETMQEIRREVLKKLKQILTIK